MKQITLWIEERSKILKADYHDKRADELEEKILQRIKENFKTLPCDFILESMTHLGAAPSVLYDDNGMWAVTGDGTQPVVTGNDRLVGLVTMGFFLEKEHWFSTIRAALKHYLFERDS